MIQQEEYAARREELMRTFEDEDCLIFLEGAGMKQRNPHVDYPFRQDANNFYFTGVNLPNVHMLLVPYMRTVMVFAPEQAPERLVWDDRLPTREELKEQVGADRVYDPSQLSSVVNRFGIGNRLYSLGGEIAEKLGRHFNHKGRNRLARKIVDMRSKKSPAEIKEIETALEITAEALDYVMRATHPGITEQEVCALIDYVYSKHDATYAFPSIVTQRGATLHIRDSSGVLRDGAMLLVDTGAEQGLYGGDITRTFPVNRTFSEIQRDVYNVLLEAQETAIRLAVPGANYLKDVREAADRVIISGLIDLGILKGDVDDILARGTMNDIFFYHFLGHQIGLSIHDCSEFNFTKDARLSADRPPVLKEGMVISCEPGIYFNEAYLTKPKYYGKHEDVIKLRTARRLIKEINGMRLEDTILVTKDGGKVLGPHIRKTVDELEAWVGNGGSIRP